MLSLDTLQRTHARNNTPMLKRSRRRRKGTRRYISPILGIAFRSTSARSGGVYEYTTMAHRTRYKALGA